MKAQMNGSECERGDCDEHARERANIGANERRLRPTRKCKSEREKEEEEAKKTSNIVHQERIQLHEQ